MEIAIAKSDLDELQRQAPNAYQLLENIALHRLLREREVEIARLRDGTPALAPIAAMPKEGEA